MHSSVERTFLVYIAETAIGRVSGYRTHLEDTNSQCKRLHQRWARRTVCFLKKRVDGLALLSRHGDFTITRLSRRVNLASHSITERTAHDIRVKIRCWLHRRIHSC